VRQKDEEEEEMKKRFGLLVTGLSPPITLGAIPAQPM